MPNAIIRANAPAMPGRRAALGSMFAASAALAAPRAANALAVVAPANLPDDPVFAAIERHRAAYERFGVAANLTDEVLAAQQGRVITSADEAGWQTAADAEESTLLSLLSTPPQTKAGARAMLEYVAPFDLTLEIGEAALRALIGGLLRSTLITGEP